MGGEAAARGGAGRSAIVRDLIIHHHLFKNAGTSIDLALQNAFGPAWTSVEGRGQELTGADLSLIAIHNPGLRAVSSHTFRPPFAARGLRLWPIVFLRHPLDRVRSAYTFERQQVSGSEGATLAKQVDFAGYVATRLDWGGDRAIRNFQTNKLGTISPRAPTDHAAELRHALACIAGLPFLGLVEAYDRSVQRFSQALRQGGFEVWFPDARANATATEDGEGELPARVAAAEAALGPALTQRFREANENDYRLYDLARWLHAQIAGDQAPR